MSTHWSIRSPRLSALERALAARNHAALEAFWQEIAAHGGPLIEPLEGDEAHMLVSFVWRDRGDTENVVIVGGPACLGDNVGNQMQRLLSSDLWYRTYLVHGAGRTTYQFSINDPLTPCMTIQDIVERKALAQADPLNPKRMVLPLPAASKKQPYVSILELPLAPPQPWAIPHAGVPRGNIKMSLLKSKILQQKYHIAVYTPPGYVDTGERYGLLLLFDGWMYMNQIALPTIMDNLIHSEKASPYVAVLFSHLDNKIRYRDLFCYRPFIDVVTEELYPWLHKHYHVTCDPTRTIVGGLSAGGLAAVFTGFCAPEIFGNVLSQSGTFWPDKGLETTGDAVWLIQQIAQQPKLSLRFSLEIGLFEKYVLADPLAATRHFRDVLHARDYEVDYAEFQGGHDYICWRGSFAERFLALAHQAG